MAWWYWVVLGLALAAIELATPGGFYVIFFAVGALAVGALNLAGVVSSAWVEWLLFPVIALITLRLFRRPLLGRLRLNERPDDVDSLVGQVAVAIDEMAPGQHGRAELRGTGWSARNVDTSRLASGQRCRVVAVHGLMLDLRQE